MKNRDIAIRLLEEIELLQASSKQIGIPYRRTARAITEDALNEARDTHAGVIAPPPLPKYIDFIWPENGRSDAL